MTRPLVAVVEDDFDVAAMMSAALTTVGYEVTNLRFQLLAQRLFPE